MDWTTGLDYWSGLVDCTEHAQQWCNVSRFAAWVGLGPHHANVNVCLLVHVVVTSVMPSLISKIKYKVFL